MQMLHVVAKDSGNTGELKEYNINDKFVMSHLSLSILIAAFSVLVYPAAEHDEDRGLRGSLKMWHGCIVDIRDDHAGDVRYRKTTVYSQLTTALVDVG